MDISGYVELNPSTGLMVFKPYVSAPGVVSGQYQFTAQAINTQSDTSYTVKSSDNGKVIVFTSGSAVSVTVPSNLGVGFNCSIIQYGTGQVSVSAGAGATMRLRASANKTGGQYAAASLISVVANEYLFTGDTTA
jgi:hypothetical protein